MSAGQGRTLGTPQTRARSVIDKYRGTDADGALRAVFLAALQRSTRRSTRRSVVIISDPKIIDLLS